VPIGPQRVDSAGWAQAKKPPFVRLDAFGAKRYAPQSFGARCSIRLDRHSVNNFGFQLGGDTKYSKSKTPIKSMRYGHAGRYKLDIAVTCLSSLFARMRPELLEEKYASLTPIFQKARATRNCTHNGNANVQPVIPS
jgi:hypothetical protein